MHGDPTRLEPDDSSHPERYPQRIESGSSGTSFEEASKEGQAETVDREGESETHQSRCAAIGEGKQGREGLHGEDPQKAEEVAFRCPDPVMNRKTGRCPWLGCLCPD